MPKDKKPEERYRRIHEIFTRRSGPKSGIRLKELADDLGISIRQLSDDMKFMREKGAPFEYVGALRAWRYKQGEDFIVLENQLLSSEEVASLRIAFELLQRVSNDHLSQGDLPKIFRKIYQASRKWALPSNTHKHIYFDPLPNYLGTQYLVFFLDAIEQNRRTTFQYLAFHAETPKTVLFDPWFLRHYDSRWYVGGFSHDPEELFVRVFPLERIVSAPVNTGFCHDKPREYDASTYWQHIYGITIPPHAQVEQVVLAFNPKQGKYFLSTPFFEPFQVLESTPERLMVSMRLMVNIDLIRKLASYGADVRVLAPEHLADTMRRFFEAALKKLTDPSPF